MLKPKLVIYQHYSKIFLKPGRDFIFSLSFRKCSKGLSYAQGTCQVYFNNWAVDTYGRATLKSGV